MDSQLPRKETGDFYSMKAKVVTHSRSQMVRVITLIEFLATVALLATTMWGGLAWFMTERTVTASLTNIIAGSGDLVGTVTAYPCVKNDKPGEEILNYYFNTTPYSESEDRDFGYYATISENYNAILLDIEFNSSILGVPSFDFSAIADTDYWLGDLEHTQTFVGSGSASYTLDFTPFPGTGVQSISVNGTPVAESSYSFSGKEITFSSDIPASGAEVIVNYYASLETEGNPLSSIIAFYVFPANALTAVNEAVTNTQRAGTTDQGAVITTYPTHGRPTSVTVNGNAATYTYSNNSITITSALAARDEIVFSYSANKIAAATQNGNSITRNWLSADTNGTSTYTSFAQMNGENVDYSPTRKIVEDADITTNFVVDQGTTDTSDDEYHCYVVLDYNVRLIEEIYSRNIANSIIFNTENLEYYNDYYYISWTPDFTIAVDNGTLDNGLASSSSSSSALQPYLYDDRKGGKLA